MMNPYPQTVLDTTKIPLLAQVPQKPFWETRPARQQAPKGSGPRQEIQNHSADYNIWYHKRLGDGRERGEERVKADTRCSILRDSGLTKADLEGLDTYICLYYARGHCTNGALCNFFHRPPTAKDEIKVDVTHDVFGRERHRTYREDMGGVGSFNRDNRTLYITGFHRKAVSEEVFRRHFGEWGEIESGIVVDALLVKPFRVIYDKGMAFIRYRLRSVAEFAKEAMSGQGLDGEECLGIRWANEDPNQSSRDKDDSKAMKDAMAAILYKRAELEQTYKYQNHGAIDYQQQAEGGAYAQPAQDPYSGYYTDPSGAAAQQANLQEYRDYFPSMYNPEMYPNTEEQYQKQQEEDRKREKAEQEAELARLTEGYQAEKYTDGAKEVGDWLQKLGLEKYRDALITSGYFDLPSLALIDDIALDATGVEKEDHRNKLLEAASTLKEQLAKEKKAQQDAYEKARRVYNTDYDVVRVSGEGATKNIPLVDYEERPENAALSFGNSSSSASSSSSSAHSETPSLSSISSKHGKEEVEEEESSRSRPKKKAKK